MRLLQKLYFIKIIILLLINLWKKLKVKKFGNKYVINDRLEFSNLVARAVRGEIIDVPGVAEGALATRKVLKKY